MSRSLDLGTYQISSIKGRSRFHNVYRKLVVCTITSWNNTGRRKARHTQAVRYDVTVRE